MAEPAPPEGYRLPLTPGPTLRSGWHTLLAKDALAALQTFAAGPDDSLWGVTDRIGRYSFETRSFEPVFDAFALYLAPISPTLCWAVGYDGDSTFVLRCCTDDGIARMPDLPGDDLPFRIAVGADETVMVFSLDRRWYELAPDRASWSVVDTGDIDVLSIDLASRDRVWMLGRQRGAAGIWQRDTASGAWCPLDGGLPAGGDYALSVCHDGSVWLVARDSAGSLLCQYMDGYWIPVESTRTVWPVVDYRVTAGSANRLFAIVRTPTGEELEAFSVGIADRLDTDWPDLSAGERAAYDHISRALGIAAGGIRDQYTNRNQPFDSWRLDIARMARPDDVAESAWQAVVEQLLGELENVVSVNNLFANLQDLNAAIGIVCATTLPGVEDRVGLSQQSKQDGQQRIEVPYGAMFRAALGQVIVRLPMPYKVVATIAAAGLFAAIEQRSGSDGGDPDARLKLRYADLTREVGQLYNDSNDANDVMRAAILADYGRLTAAGAAIRAGLWAWPERPARDLAEPAAAAYERYFYRALMPAKWQIVSWCDWWVNKTPNPPYPIRIDVPAYAALRDIKHDSKSAQVFDIWVCNMLGAANIAGERLEPYPAEELMAYLFDTLGEDREAFFKSGDGWTLTQVAGIPESSRVSVALPSRRHGSVIMSASEKGVSLARLLRGRAAR